MTTRRTLGGRGGARPASGPAVAGVAGRLPAALGVAALWLVALSVAAPSASAATGAVVSPAPGTTVEAAGPVEVRAEVAGPVEREVTLQLTPPGGPARAVASVAPGAGGTASYTLDVGCPEPAPGCIDDRPAVNGAWTVTLDGADAEPRSFTLRVPPADPAEVSATRRDAVVVAEWRRGAEPDLVAYDVRDGDGTVLLADFPVAEACRETACRAEVTTSSSIVRVRAVRRACPACDETLASADSAATVTAAGGASPGPADGSPTPATDPATTAAPTVSASAAPVAAGALPGLALASPAAPVQFDGAPLVAAPPLPVVAGELVIGAEDDTDLLAEPRHVPVGTSAAAARARFMAGALLLLLVGAHLRRWLAAGAASAQVPPG